MRLRTFAVLAALLLVTAGAAHAATVIEKEFRYDASRVRIAQRDGYTSVEASGSMREFRPGRTCRGSASGSTCPKEPARPRSS